MKIYIYIVWCYFITFDCLLATYASLTGILGEDYLPGPIAGLLVLVIMGSVIPLIEIGGRAVDRLQQLSWFGLSWGLISAVSHVAAHCLVLFYISPPLTIGYDATKIYQREIFGKSVGGTSLPPFQLTRLTWIVILTGTFIFVPLLVHVGILFVRVLDGSLDEGSSTKWSLWLATTAQLAVWGWFVLL